METFDRRKHDGLRRTERDISRAMRKRKCVILFDRKRDVQRPTHRFSEWISFIA